MSWVDYVGFLAALTVLATFCMDTILPLRGLAIASNILFIVYGLAAQLYPVLLLHAVLLPINIRAPRKIAASPSLCESDA
jgi:fluoride ion exporter CrcB/FEX